MALRIPYRFIREFAEPLRRLIERDFSEIENWANLRRDFFYTGGLGGGAAVAFTDFLTQNEVGSLPFPYTMEVVAYLGHGGNGAANQVSFQVRDEGGAQINLKGIVMDIQSEWNQKQALAAGGDRNLSTIFGVKNYAAGVKCGFRLAYKVDASNVSVDAGVHVRLIPQ